ncbi:BCL-2-associated athanogene 3 [Artemisia annua]|uniref:BCL-2-associated athanogene 3 n=1 Tax=Artemisia annua TaxID=35608 RepID=A0A2U1NFD4_ARTAN|nr:BCL-2-associated athanogene 3 [Artemisia annua]
MMPMSNTKPTSGGGGSENEWEVRPGGMLVQKRDPNDEVTRVPPPTIRVRVKYNSIYHEINISSQATFGELKKMLSGPTGLHHEDQKLTYKGKDRSNKTYLDFVGVKDRSKMVLVEDPLSQEKRYIEMRNNAKMEKAAKSISEISLEVDRLAGQGEVTCTLASCTCKAAMGKYEVAAKAYFSAKKLMISRTNRMATYLAYRPVGSICERNFFGSLVDMKQPTLRVHKTFIQSFRCKHKLTS